MKYQINKFTLLNTVKIAGAAVLAICIAAALDLQFAISAGIVAILTIQPTKKETIKTAFARLCAFVAALLIALISFELIGYTVEAFFVYLIIFVLICQCFGWYSAMAMNSVLVSHFLTFSHMSNSAIINEILIFIVGVGVGVVFNLHLHKKTNYIEEMKEETDRQIRNILHRMSVRIVDRDISDYNGQCFQKLNISIRNAKNIAEENFNNQFGNNDTFDREYIRMRERQVQVLYDMYKRVRSLQTKPVTAQVISDFLEEMAGAFHRENTGLQLLQTFYKMDEEMKSKPLPVTREEFEDRAQLYTLLRDIEEFIKIKWDFSNKQQME
ncbi:MAG: hypothetical protein K2G89_01550 [Lachnospiraceae bacterium]|nr:hypothetical protein [Lachnospiraceae bacterium]